MVAISVGACLGGDEPCREQIAEKQKSDLSGPAKRRFVSVNGVLLDSTWTVEQISDPSADFERLGRFQIAAGTQADVCQRSGNRWTGWVV